MNSINSKKEFLELEISHLQKQKNQKGKTFGYIRVSSMTQNLEPQRNFLIESPYLIDQFFEDIESGNNLNRPGFKQLLSILREDDWLVVSSLDRIGRSIQDLNATLLNLNQKKVRFISLKENFDFSNSTGMLMFNIMASFAEYERCMKRERQKIGIEEAKKKGLYKGRKPITLPSNFHECLLKYKHSTRVQKYSLKMFASETGLKMSTLINFINKYKSM
jgi:DNA invertase Pin-like site-specific DNA recombinase